MGVEAELKKNHFKLKLSTIRNSVLVQQQRAGAIRTLMFMKGNWCENFKVCTCMYDRKQKNIPKKSVNTSPIVSIESVIIDTDIDASENRDVVIVDVPSVFLAPLISTIVSTCQT